MAYVFLLNKNLRIIRIKLFQTYKNYDIFHIIDQIKGSKVLLWIYVKLCNGLTRQKNQFVIRVIWSNVKAYIFF